MEDNRKKAALRPRLGQIEKQFGKGSVMRLGGRPPRSGISKAVPSGSLGLDIRAGVSADLPRGRRGSRIYGA